MLTAIFAALVLLTAVVVATLYWDDILKWFQKPDVAVLVEQDAQNVAFTLKQELDNGNYRVLWTYLWPKVGF